MRVLMNVGLGLNDHLLEVPVIASLVLEDRVHSEIGCCSVCQL